jgi:hypothetical protein
VTDPKAGIKHPRYLMWRIDASGPAVFYHGQIEASARAVVIKESERSPLARSRAWLRVASAVCTSRSLQGPVALVGSERPGSVRRCLNVVLVCLSHRSAGSLFGATYDAGRRASAALFRLAAALVQQHGASRSADLSMS